MTAALASDINARVTDVSTPSMQQGLRLWTTGLLASAIAGGAAGLVGLAIGTLSITDLAQSGTDLSTLSSVLVAISFPLFILAAHCIDKVAAADMAIRLEYCRQNGLNDDCHP